MDDIHRHKTDDRPLTYWPCPENQVVVVCDSCQIQGTMFCGPGSEVTAQIHISWRHLCHSELNTEPVLCHVTSSVTDQVTWFTSGCTTVVDLLSLRYFTARCWNRFHSRPQCLMTSGESLRLIYYSFITFYSVIPTYIRGRLTCSTVGLEPNSDPGPRGWVTPIKISKSDFNWKEQKQHLPKTLKNKAVQIHTELQSWSH